MLVIIVHAVIPISEIDDRIIALMFLVVVCFCGTLTLCFILVLCSGSKILSRSLFHLHRRVGTQCTYSPMKMEQTVCSETLAFKLQTPGNNPEEGIRHSKHGESLKSRMCGSYTTRTDHINDMAVLIDTLLFSSACR
jgi:hypothetical protein